MNTKPGIKTTEFWVVTIPMVVGFLQQFGVLPQVVDVPDAWVALVQTVTPYALAVAYGIYRVIVKRQQPPLSG